MKVADLRQKLQEVLEELEQYDDERKIRLKRDSYWCSDEFFACRQGFVDFYDLVEDKEGEDND